ncbi:uncharacterized protein LOC105161090 [Sesamum indicum]|uniref:Uncharacterized protein LOC105161090 n=1 Tax=Sesamum indicum TaxID=4182 RepID=A0A8M8UZA1_SESIN|nr:uncharacterized protein LOC105161090 [Sesamum indicum]
MSPENMKKRYWKLSLMVHPDKCSHPQAHQAFVKLNKAFKDLQDPDKVSVGTFSCSVSKFEMFPACCHTNKWFDSYSGRFRLWRRDILHIINIPLCYICDLSEYLVKKIVSSHRVKEFMLFTSEFTKISARENFI